MKKLGICFVLVFLVSGTLCFAQSGNDAQRIVGTWSGSISSTNYSITFTFNSNGTYSVSGYNTATGNFIINNSKLLLERNGNVDRVFDYYFSTDGRQLVIIGGDSSYTSWLKKQ